MSFTYTHSPTTSDRDAVRLTLGDTDSGDPLLYDTEIDYYLTQGGSVVQASVLGCEAILARLARRVNVTVKGVSKDLTDQYTHYEALLPRLRRQATRGGITLFAGGISKADAEARRSDEDRQPPFFTRDTFRVDGTGSDDGDADDN